ncbi:hypothetical protein OG216_09665 [Streptomycetaceae bacterium NBC_01309]
MTCPYLRTPWFDLARHDDPDPAAPDPEPTDPPADPEPDAPDPEGADQLGDPGKKALATMKAEKAEAKREAAEAKRQAAALAKKVAEFEDRDKSELEKATARAEEAAAQAQTATRRAVLAEVKAQAADLFEDRDDARVNLADKLESYIGDNGEIDEDAIAADLAAVLDKKPHLRKQAAEPEKKTPKPDPGQGPRPPVPPTDYRTAPREDVERKLAELGVRLRR